MSQPVPTYRRLPGRSNTVINGLMGVRTRLYEGEDHVLLSRTKAYAEEYARFYYIDIEAITMCRSDAGKCRNLLFGTIALALLVWTAFFIGAPTGSANVTIIVLLIAAGLNGLVVLVNTLFGPTVTCHVRTAIQESELPCLGRQR